MPELPDLVYICSRLNAILPGRTIESVDVREPIVIRNLTGQPFAEALIGRVFAGVIRQGPFLVFDLSGGRRLIIHPMLAGALSVDSKGSGLVTIHHDAGRLTYLDAKKMGKIYLIDAGQEKEIPRFETQGVDLTSAEFTRDAFRARIDASRRQVRAFLMEQEQISAIGNAYADEILFDACIHPKTFCQQLEAEEKDRLYESVNTVIRRAIETIANARPALQEKYRKHMLVRNKKNEPCPRCGAKIRRENVLGYDTFFCPVCQPAKRKLFIDWNAEGPAKKDQA